MNKSKFDNLSIYDLSQTMQDLRVIFFTETKINKSSLEVIRKYMNQYMDVAKEFYKNYTKEEIIKRSKKITDVLLDKHFNDEVSADERLVPLKELLEQELSLLDSLDSLEEKNGVRLKATRKRKDKSE